MRKILIIILLVIVVFCSYNIYIIYSNYEKANNEYENLLSSYTYTIDDDKISQNQEILKENAKDKLENKYIFSKTIDFDSLTSLNADIIGWITIPGTIIDYPIVKSADNNEYLHLTFLKESNSAGSIFLDVRNEKTLTDYNSVIYGHNMKNGSMFSALRNYLEESFYKDHNIIEIYLPNENRVYKIISCYATTKTSNSYIVDFNDDAEYESWLKEISSLSQYKVEPYDKEKETITLSTCNGRSGSEKRWVLHIQKLY